MYILCFLIWPLYGRFADIQKNSFHWILEGSWPPWPICSVTYEGFIIEYNFKMQEITSRKKTKKKALSQFINLPRVKRDNEA